MEISGGVIVRLDKLLERLEYEVVQGSDGIEITTLINDSRKVEEGSVFVCISGAVSDGHKYIPDVAAKGAAAVVVEREVEAPENVTVIRVTDTRYALALMSAAYFDYPAEKMKVIGITGTKGKTTTTYMIKSILDSVGYKVGLIGTIEAIIGDRKIPAANTTSRAATTRPPILARSTPSGRVSCPSLHPKTTIPSSRFRCQPGTRASRPRRRAVSSTALSS